MSSAIKAAENDDAASDATAAEVVRLTKAVVAASQAGTVAGDIVTRTIEALTVIVQSAVFLARELFDGFAAEFKMIAALTVDDDFDQAGLYLGDPTAWV
jgi:hypothetical protein